MALAWFHIQWSTFGNWLPGDKRGFRNRFHRIHSSGDYKNPPPTGEHQGLRRYARRIMHREPVRLSPGQRERARDAILDKAGRMNLLVVAAAVSATHAHVLAKMDPDEISEIVGKLKRHSSHALRNELPGQVWGARKHEEPVRDRAHQVRVVNYILEHGPREGAATWKYGESGAR